jgi:hypothetical protein
VHSGPGNGERHGQAGSGLVEQGLSLGDGHVTVLRSGAISSS